MLDKPSLRRMLAEKRQALSAAECARRSLELQQRLIADPLFAGARCVGLYRAMSNEVGTDALHQAALDQHKRIAYPEVRSKAESMRFVECVEGAPWTKSPLGFEAPVGEELSLQAIDLFVLPGLGFDRSGRRLGRGAGHYDRLLVGGDAVRIGLCFDFQLLGELPEDPWDVRLDAVATEREIIRTSSRPGR